MTSQAATAATPFTGRKMLFSVLAFFGVIIAANMTMMTFALTTHTGTVVPNSYVASQDFNKHIAADAAQKRTGWQSTFSRDGKSIQITFQDAAGKPVRDLQVGAVLGRPVTARSDMTLRLKETTPGLYKASAELAPGEWRLDAMAQTASGQSFRLIKTFIVTAPAS